MASPIKSVFTTLGQPFERASAPVLKALGRAFTLPGGGGPAIPPPIPPALTPTAKPQKKSQQQSFLSGVASAALPGGGGGSQTGKSLLGA